MSVLSLKNVEKRFFQGKEEFSVLEGVNLEIAKSEIISLIGPSGSGKTTLLQICGLLDRPSAGEVFISDHNCAKISDAKATSIRRNHLGFIYQFHHLLPEFTALENIIIPQMINGKDKGAASLEADEILDKLGLGSRLNNIPSELSGGEQQRVAIARALVNKPSLILADEPTGNLDPQNSEKVFNLLLDEVRTREVSAMIVTHNLEIAKKTDRILTIKNGKIESYN
jgi:lipoprotein-releasing system ATP-binding protein